MAGKESFIGSVDLFAGENAPDGWAFCNGKLLNVTDYYLLFMIIGSSFGGDGRTTFRLPDLQGRVPIGSGKSKSLTERFVGQMGGTETVKLTVDQIPSHSHRIRCDIKPGRNAIDNPNNNYPAYPSDGEINKNYCSESNEFMADNMVSTVGSNSPHNNMQSYIALNYIICLDGVNPPHWK